MTESRVEIAETLTPRQRELITMVGEGCPNREIARRLNLSEGTVKLQLHNIYQKLGVPNRTALTAFAIPDPSADRCLMVASACTMPTSSICMNGSASARRSWSRGKTSCH